MESMRDITKRSLPVSVDREVGRVRRYRRAWDSMEGVAFVSGHGVSRLGCSAWVHGLRTHQTDNTCRQNAIRRLVMSHALLHPVSRPHVLGLGTAGLDFLAVVSSFPQPDTKIRTSEFKMLGGGNCANTLTGLSRLQIASSLVSKCGDDVNGNQIAAELEADGVNTRYLVRKAGMYSPFTYVIVDAQENTRTCIHTPATEDLLLSDLAPEMLDGVDLVHLDGRHTTAAIQMAQWAVDRAIPVALDVERDRPGIRDLIPLVDFIFTNRQYPGIVRWYCWLHHVLRILR